ncbi:hypothetical protein GUITHDRAFT_106808 [Guillardia theta CCMP2712]|uniref:RING-type E3 ubiquitin transferase n=1 Tax=Guillardia theta (strain CCMP2712) TaxID=905079 RepID=L1JGC6_GUITC|nr:hypothetical protein GUITHDRAFT_106808 [Guillardia theta CCMP2712]EKX47362.1 hypothetical protein GUITHDRAFT_106808 [Guillardia theta CCMP2712]|eukprot:XP_005834342.1 hypothetical protein GUITHDRAFT_106808 [Guillardia theta CCMP2712]
MALWEFLEHGRWCAFDKQAELVLEQAVAFGQTQTTARFYNPRLGTDVDYVYDLVSMCQVSKLAHDDQCPICLEGFLHTHDDFEKCIRLGRCGNHHFHRKCVDNPNSFARGFIICPICKERYGVETGSMPTGKMIVSHIPNACDGFHGTGSYMIKYDFHGGVQVQGMPTPGKSYPGTSRIAYLPDTPEGKKVLGLLKKSFSRGLTFTIGRSVTRGVDNLIVWNGIHHKTSMTGGVANFGYPDAEYLNRVQKELADKGITPDS